MVTTLRLAVSSSASFSGRILTAVKTFGGQRLVLPQAEISRGAQKLARTLCDLDRKKIL